jgi:hypothetical protein
MVVLAAVSADAQGRRGGRGGRSSGGGGAVPALSPELEQVVVTFEGVAKTMDKKHLQIEQGDGQTLAFHSDKKTKYILNSKEVPPAEIPLQAKVRVDARHEGQGSLIALKVTALSGGQAPEQQSLITRDSAK